MDTNKHVLQENIETNKYKNMLNYMGIDIVLCVDDKYIFVRCKNGHKNILTIDDYDDNDDGLSQFFFMMDYYETSEGRIYYANELKKIKHKTKLFEKIEKSGRMEYIRIPLNDNEQETKWKYSDLQKWINNGRNKNTIKYITALHCNYNELKIVPPEIGQLENLRELHCNENNLKHLPPEIGQLKKLRLLTCIKNNLETLPHEISQLKNLRELRCDENNLKSLPSEIGQLTNLQLLTCDGNDLKSLPPEIGQLKNLQILSCFCNNITTLPSEINELFNLKDFNCSNNEITTLPPKLYQLINLNNFNCSYNKIRHISSQTRDLFDRLYDAHNPDIDNVALAEHSSMLVNINYFTQEHVLIPLNQLLNEHSVELNDNLYDESDNDSS
jgi:Leucine-rich repeat (LRR) protein